MYGIRRELEKGIWEKEQVVEGAIGVGAESDGRHTSPPAILHLRTSPRRYSTAVTSFVTFREECSSTAVIVGRSTVFYSEGLTREMDVFALLR